MIVDPRIAGRDHLWKQQLLDDPQAVMRPDNFPEIVELEELRQSAETSREAEVVGHVGTDPYRYTSVQRGYCCPFYTLGQTKPCRYRGPCRADGRSWGADSRPGPQPRPRWQHRVPAGRVHVDRGQGLPRWDPVSGAAAKGVREGEGRSARRPGERKPVADPVTFPDRKTGRDDIKEERRTGRSYCLGGRSSGWVLQREHYPEGPTSGRFAGWVPGGRAKDGSGRPF